MLVQPVPSFASLLPDPCLAPTSRFCASGFIIIRLKSREVMGTLSYSEPGLLESVLSEYCPTGENVRQVIDSVSKYPYECLASRILGRFKDRILQCNMLREINKKRQPCRICRHKPGFKH